jgi:hypothetical protein
MSTQLSLPFIWPTNSSRCHIEGCHNSIQTKGLCSTHYQQFLRNGNSFRQPVAPKPVCSIEGCKRSHVGNGLCRKHYDHLRRHESLSAMCRADLTQLRFDYLHMIIDCKATECLIWHTPEAIQDTQLSAD